MHSCLAMYAGLFVTCPDWPRSIVMVSRAVRYADAYSQPYLLKYVPFALKGERIEKRKKKKKSKPSAE